MSKATNTLKNSKLPIFSLRPFIERANLFKEVIKDKPKSLNIVFEGIKEVNDIQRFEKNMSFQVGKTNHIDLTPNSDAKNLSGKAFIRARSLEDPSKFLLREANDVELNKANVLAFGGVDYHSQRHLSALLKAVGTLAEYSAEDTSSTSKCEAIAIYPEVSPAERYEASELYNLDSKYYPPYITKRVEKYILPKISGDETIFNPDNPITLFTFSVGGREALMMETSLKDILKGTYHLNDKEISKIFMSIRILSVGLAVDPYALDLNGFSKIIVFAADDTKVLRPEPLQQEVLLSPTVLNNKYSRLSYKHKDDNGESIIIILGHGVLPHIVKDTISMSDHSLPHYVKGIQDSPSEYQENISNFLSCYNMNQSNDIGLSGMDDF